MSDATTVALITSGTTILVAALPIAFYFLRARVQITESEERLIRDAVIEAGRYAEEWASGKLVSGDDKLRVAVERATALLDRYAAVRTPDPEELARRVESHLAVAVPGHRGVPTQAIATVPPPRGPAALEADEIEAKLKAIRDEAEERRPSRRPDPEDPQHFEDRITPVDVPGERKSRPK